MVWGLWCVVCAAEVEAFMKRDRFLAAHVRYYVREMRIAAYAQLLESYSSLRLDYMADTFGVSLEFIDKSLFYFHRPLYHLTT